MTLRIVLVAAAALALAACSGSAPSDITAGEGSQSESTPTDPAKSGASATGASGSGSSTSSGAADGGGDADKDAGPDSGGGGGDDCTEEVEPNDIASAATPFTKSFCGKVNGGGDLDYGTFVVPAGKTKVTLSHTESGNFVEYRFVYNNLTIPSAGSTIIAIPGGTYHLLVRLTAGHSGKPTYRADLAFD